MQCPDYLKNGNLNTTCKRSIGEKCAFTCRVGFEADIDYVICTKGGRWDNNTDTLCLGNW